MLFFYTWNSSQRTFFCRFNFVFDIFSIHQKEKKKLLHFSAFIFRSTHLEGFFLYTSLLCHYPAGLKREGSLKSSANYFRIFLPFFSSACIFIIIGLVLISYDSKAKIYNLVPFLQLIENEKHKNP